MKEKKSHLWFNYDIDFSLSVCNIYMLWIFQNVTSHSKPFLSVWFQINHQLGMWRWCCIFVSLHKEKSGYVDSVTFFFLSTEKRIIEKLKTEYNQSDLWMYH